MMGGGGVGQQNKRLKKKNKRLKGLVQDVFFKQFWSVLVSRGPKMFWRGLAGPEMTFWDDFC